MKATMHIDISEHIDLLRSLKGHALVGKTKRVGFTLPSLILKALENVREEGGRSRFVAQAIVEKIEREARDRVFHHLLSEYAQETHDDTHLAEEWFALEEEGEVLYEKPRKKQPSKKR